MRNCRSPAAPATSPRTASTRSIRASASPMRRAVLGGQRRRHQRVRDGVEGGLGRQRQDLVVERRDRQLLSGRLDEALDPVVDQRLPARIEPGVGAAERAGAGCAEAADTETRVKASIRSRGTRTLYIKLACRAPALLGGRGSVVHPGLKFGRGLMTKIALALGLCVSRRRSRRRRPVGSAGERPAAFSRTGEKGPEVGRAGGAGQIVGPIYSVGTRGLSVFLIKTTAGHIIINSAMPGSGPMTEAAIRKLGLDPNDIKLLLTGHATAITPAHMRTCRSSPAPGSR